MDYIFRNAEAAGVNELESAFKLLVNNSNSKI